MADACTNMDESQMLKSIYNWIPFPCAKFQNQQNLMMPNRNQSADISLSEGWNCSIFQPEWWLHGHVRA